VTSGVRQEGVISPWPFAIYMDDLFGELMKKGVGCHVIDMFMAAIFYADDVCLMAPTRSAMQILLDVCQTYADYWCVKYNEKKTKVMVTGKDIRILIAVL
jgi:hypothetical protein